MKLLFVTPAYVPAWSFGGVVASSHRMLAEAVAQGEDVTVFTTRVGLPENDEGARTGFRLLDGVKVHYFKCDRTKPILARALTKEIERRAGEFDLMHLVGVWQPISIGARRAAVRAGLPYVVGLRGALDPWSFNHKRLKKFLYYRLFEQKNIHFASGILYTSKSEFTGSSRFARVGQEQSIVPNGIDFKTWFPNPQAGRQWRAEAGIPSATFLFLYVGRLYAVKNLTLLLSALAPLSSRNWHLAFVGKDEDGTGSILRKQASESGLSERVSFHPTLPAQRLPAVYSAANLFVLPSHHENFSNAVLESLACGCPVLISDQVAIGESLGDINGIVVRARNVDLWTEALAAALDRREDFSITPPGRDEIERRFSIANCAGQLIQFHRLVATRHQKRINAHPSPAR